MKNLTEIDMKLEVTVIGVTDVERAKEFYSRLGWRLDVTPPRVVQFTPYGSNASIHFGEGVTTAAPGSGRHFLIVSDLVETHEARFATAKRQRAGAE